MVEAARDAHRAAAGVEYLQPGFSTLHAADAREGERELGGKRLQLRAARLRRGKRQFVVIAAAEHEPGLKVSVPDVPHLGGSRQQFVFNDCAHAGALEDMTEVLRKSVRNVDRGAG